MAVHTQFSRPYDAKHQARLSNESNGHFSLMSAGSSRGADRQSSLSSCRSSAESYELLSECDSDCTQETVDTQSSAPEVAGSSPGDEGRRARALRRQRSIHRRMSPLSSEQVDSWTRWLNVAEEDCAEAQSDPKTFLRTSSWSAGKGYCAGEERLGDGAAAAIGRRKGPPGEEGGSAPPTLQHSAGAPEEEDVEREEITKPRSAGVTTIIQRELDRQPLNLDPSEPIKSCGSRGGFNSGEFSIPSAAPSPAKRDRPPVPGGAPAKGPLQEGARLERQSSQVSASSPRSEAELPAWARVPMSPAASSKASKALPEGGKKKGERRAGSLERAYSGEETLSEGEWTPGNMRYVAAVVSSLGKGSAEDQREVAAILRGLIRKQPLNKRSLVQAGGIPAMVQVLATSSDSETLEHLATTLLNVANSELCEEQVASCGGFEALVRVLKLGNGSAKANAAACMFMLGESAEHRLGMCRAGAVLPLLRLMLGGSLRGKKDAALALYQLTRHAQCAIEVAECGGVMALVGTLLEGAAGLEDKVAAVLANLGKVPEGRAAMEEQGAIPMLVDLVEEGSARAREDCVGTLLALANTSGRAFDMIHAEGMLPSLRVLSEKGTSKARTKARALVDLLRAAGSSDESGEFGAADSSAEYPVPPPPRRKEKGGWML